jgi:membrane protease YdiL (CAAX protease family)
MLLPPEDSPASPLPAPEVTPAPPSNFAENPPWSGWDVLRIVFVAVFVIVVCSFGMMWFAMHDRAFGSKSMVELARDPLVVIPAQFLAYVVVVIFMYMMVTREYHRRFLPTVRWHWPHGLWSGFVVMGIVLAIAGQLLSAVLPVPKSLPIDQFFRTTAGAYVMAIFGVTVAPFVEELFFRGFLYPVLARRLGVAGGIVLTATAFALVHASQLAHAWGPLLVLFLVGTALTAVRAVTRSIAASMLVHIGYNLTLFTMLFFASQHFHRFDRIS